MRFLFNNIFNNILLTRIPQGTRFLLPVILAFLIVVAGMIGWAQLIQAAAAGNEGDYYNNIDNGHAVLDISQFPGLTKISEGSAGTTRVYEDRILIGNASVVLTGELGGSIPLAYMMSQARATGAYMQYINNNAYWHPEHRDYDELDKYHARTPTVNTSQGSSFSELDEMEKWFSALAAFDTDVKAKLKANGLIMPTLQMMFRRASVASDAAYLTGVAHPGAFSNFGSKDSLVTMAQAMAVDVVPPMAKVRVVSDTYNAQPKADFFESPFTHQSEDVYDVPVSVSRIFRGHEYTKTIIATAEDSFDIDNHPLTYHWKVLQGDTSKIRITPRNEDSSEVALEIDYHPQELISGTNKPSNTVVIGLFVHNGTYYSAPAFLNSYTLDNEDRTYNESDKLEKITYNSNWVHPSISRPKSWISDTFLYDGIGSMNGWLREKDTGEIDRFTKEGFLAITTNGSGVVSRVRCVDYYLDNGEVYYKVSGSSDGVSYPTSSCSAQANDDSSSSSSGGGNGGGSSGEGGDSGSDSGESSANSSQSSSSAQATNTVSARVKSVFQKTYGFTPTTRELAYWNGRLSDKKTFTALAGAMQFHRLKGSTGTGSTTNRSISGPSSLPSTGGGGSLTSIGDLNSLHRRAYGRNPTISEWHYWATRLLDKGDRAALLGAMEYHRINEITH